MIFLTANFSSLEQFFASSRFSGFLMFHLGNGDRVQKCQENPHEPESYEIVGDMHWKKG
jgi:hypothetical protein